MEEAFEGCLFEAVERCGWKLYAYVIMRNHSKYFRCVVCDGLCRRDFLSILGERDSFSGMHRYAKHLELLEEGNPKQHDELTKSYCGDRFIGAKDDKKLWNKS